MTVKLQYTLWRLGDFVMDLIGKQVRHSKFGDGVIVAQETTTVTVNFSSEIETKKFIYPACFKTYLKLRDR